MDAFEVCDDNAVDLGAMPTESRPAEKKYEVAISCLKEDERVARELHDLLQPRVGPVFLFTQNQEDLMAKDGLEVFGRIYREDSRVVVIIYREGWGKTKWTGVEDRAIRDLVLNFGLHRVFVYSMDDSVPTWLPRTYLWGGQPYGLTAFAAAIERKVQEEGGNVGEEDVVSGALRVQHSIAAAKAREDRRSSTEAVQAVDRERKAIDARLEEVVATVGASESGLLHGHMYADMYTVLTNEVAITFYWSGGANNSIRGGKLTLEMSTGPLGRYGWRNDASRQVAEYELELAEDDTTWRWVELVGRKRQYTSIELADDAIRRLMVEHGCRSNAALQRQRRS